MNPSDRPGEHRGHKEEVPILANNSQWQRNTWKEQSMDLPAWDPTKVMWLLLIYEITTPAIEAMDRKVSEHLRSPTIIYINRTLEQFHTTKLTSILYNGRFQSRQNRLVLTLRDSADDRIAVAGIKTRSGSGQLKHHWTMQRACFTNVHVTSQTPGHK